MKGHVWALPMRRRQSVALRPANVEGNASSLPKLRKGSRLSTISLLVSTLLTSTLLASDPPLHRAVYEDRTADAKALLAKGADSQAKNRYGITPLTLACTNGNAALVKALLAAGADANALGQGGMTPLMTAARTGRPAPVKMLLDAGAKVNASDRKGQTALMWAAVEGHAPVVRILLDAGADHEAALNSGFNAWFFASRQGHGEVIDVLLDAGADVNAALKTKSAAKGGWGTSGKGRAPRNGTSALIFAIQNGHFALAAKLLEAGADANDMRSGSTPLHILTWVRKPVIGDGIDGQPPPQGSGDMTSLAFVEVLIKKRGADVNAQLGGPEALGKVLGRPGSTPFLLASRTADLPYMKLLVKHGADPKLPNKQGRTPLLAAAGVVLGPQMDEAATEDDAVAAVKYLLDELGADIDVVDKERDTVMHAAAYKQSPVLVRLLAERGADIEVWNTKNRRGWTPLLIAQGFRYGNFKPSADTAAALGEVMKAADVEAPPAPPRPGTGKKEEYQD